MAEARANERDLKCLNSDSSWRCFVLASRWASLVAYCRVVSAARLAVAFYFSSWILACCCSSLVVLVVNWEEL